MITVNEMAKLVGGTVHGNGDVKITGIASPGFAKDGDMTFASDERELKAIEKSKAACVLTTLEPLDFPKTVLSVSDLKESLTVLYNAMQEMRPAGKGMIHPTAIIDGTAALGANVSIGPYTVIGKDTKVGDNSSLGANCTIGDNVTIGSSTRLYSNVSVYELSVIGDNVIIHAGAVIGSDGFGFIPKGDRILKIPQMCNVIIEDDVEIGANTCVDRGTFTNTVIGRGTKLDNLVQVAHNVKLGRNVLVAGQSGIAGSATVGDNTMMGGQVGISDHVKIGKNVKIGAQSGVSRQNVKDGAVLFGYPAKDANEITKQMAFVSLLYKNASKIMRLLKKFSE